MPRHIEQPAFRHSKPASAKTLSRPSASAAALTAIEPGHDHRAHAGGDLLAAHDLRRGAQVGQPAVRARADEDAVDRDVCDRGAGLEAHVLERARIGVVARLGDAARDRGDLAGVRAPADLRSERRDVDDDLAVEAGPLVRAVGLPAGERLLPRLLHARPTLEVGVRRLVRRDQARAGAGLDRHVGDGQAALHRERADRLAGVLDDVAGRAVGADLADQPEDQVLRRDAARRHALEAHEHLRAALVRQGLRGEHLLDLARADAEGERSERAVRRGVRVAAHDRHAGLRDAELGTDHVHDPLAAMSATVQADAEVVAVSVERLELLSRHVIVDRP